MNRLLVLFFVIAVIATPATLTVHMAVDNAFSLYLSTSDAVLGTFVGSSSDWQNASSFNVTLTGGMTNYIHIVADNQGGPGGFLGDFAVDDPLFQFANGTQTLLTVGSGWGYNVTGFGDPYLTPFDRGPRGGGDPWGFPGGLSIIDGSAHWIWGSSSLLVGDPDLNGPDVYFSTPITTQGGTVPEPATFSLFGAALAAGWLYRRRRT